MSEDGAGATVEATILGCGSSGGVPRLGGPDGAGNWGVCDPSEPKNRRRRCSVLLERRLIERRGPGGVTRVLIDAGPDVREQLLSARVGALDAVVLTHDHADHLHGLDDLRQIVLNSRKMLDVYADARTTEVLLRRFGYAFEQPPGSDYPPILTARRIDEALIEEAAPLVISGAGGDIALRPFRVAHGRQPALGFRIGGLAYLPDVSAIPDPVWPVLEGLDIWVLDALRYTPHPSHANLETALAWIDQAAPRRAVLTNMHLDLDYATLAAETPAHVEPAYDGMVLPIA